MSGTRATLPANGSVGGKIGMNRLYAIEATPSVTGAMADHRVPLRPSEIPNFTAAIAAKMGLAVQSPTAPERAQWIDALVRDLQKHRGASVVIAGDQQPPGVHALAHAMNQALDNIGKTVVYTDPIGQSRGSIGVLRELVKDESGSGRILSRWAATGLHGACGSWFCRAASEGAAAYSFESL